MCCSETVSAIVGLELASGVASPPHNLQGGRVKRVVTPGTNSGPITLVFGRITIGPGVDAEVDIDCPAQLTGTSGDAITLFLAGV